MALKFKHELQGGALALMLGLAPFAALAQDGQGPGDTMADMRQEMAVLAVELQQLKRELSTTGAPGTSFAGGDTLARIDLIEAELSRITDKIENLEFRIDEVVADGMTQLNDMNFRLCELEPDCDIGALPELKVIGGQAPVAAAGAAPIEGPAGGIEGGIDGMSLAVSERADFEAAQAVLAEGDPAKAGELFSTFLATYPGSPLAGHAHYYRGESLREAGLVADAARAYLESFSVEPVGVMAPDALFKLGLSLGDLGQASEACVTLGEVGARFPDAPAAAEARGAMGELGCS